MQQEDLSHLPDTFDRSTVVRNPTDNCMLCDAPFTKRIVMRNRNPIRHCKRCGRSICAVCSDTKRQLSKDDPEKFRVCDRCNYEMDNILLRKNLIQVSREA